MKLNQQKNGIASNYLEHLNISPLVPFNKNITLNSINNLIKIILKRSDLGLRELYSIIRCINIIEGLYNVKLKRIDSKP